MFDDYCYCINNWIGLFLDFNVHEIILYSLHVPLAARFVLAITFSNLYNEFVTF